MFLFFTNQIVGFYIQNIPERKMLQIKQRRERFQTLNFPVKKIESELCKQFFSVFIYLLHFLY